MTIESRLIQGVTVLFVEKTGKFAPRILTAACQLRNDFLRIGGVVLETPKIRATIDVNSALRVNERAIRREDPMVSWAHAQGAQRTRQTIACH